MDEPQPNPNWEYIKLWNQAEQIGIELMTLNAYLINQSCASPTADKRIEELLRTLQNSVGEALQSHSSKMLKEGIYIPPQ
ncbi:hypothetical protein Cri9333_0517 [Crinalium epipsammum PCC 9333]|uniref:Uncharacterized protein n=1 Tax=Crinalium epipsammum PCC 9333 TaxID=1173022 RepID=K9VWD9_9CYAN|nr:hypothetical protein [Crinalium epipsammum]AFZ11475.1 hypothetical protein Cri9333_0517 [Crinalium epipsammum PCC 9333]